MADTLLQTEAAAFGYGGRPVVRDVSLTVRGGEFVALVGPNGSGKTTLLRGLLGFVPLLAGRLERRAPLRLGYVPQHAQLDPLYPLSAEDVVRLGTFGALRPWQRLGARERAGAREALVACRADGFARVRWGALSGGQRQRVLIARALAARPDLLLLDEPTAGIDPETELAILDVLDALRRTRPLAIWMVSHRLQALVGRVDRIVTVEEGCLQPEAAA